MWGPFAAVVPRRQVLFLVVLPLALSPAMAAAQTPTIVRVEEDWELIVAAPDHYTDAPQVTCVISPTGTVDSIHAAFDLNHQSQPQFVSGGLQLQLWNGEMPLSYHDYPNPAMLTQNGETVSWTQRMEVSGGLLRFEIVNGSSSAWGSFGGQGYLKAGIPTALQDLSGYRPGVSVAQSGVGYAGNRVQSLTLKAVRVYTSAGEMVTDSTVRTVYPKN
ncbi:MAG: hypothetical protein HUU20_02485 [Pirellulales bacterium]|nr:hypothetical protein [Pirellulales bacterium]